MTKELLEELIKAVGGEATLEELLLFNDIDEAIECVFPVEEMGEWQLTDLVLSDVMDYIELKDGKILGVLL